jgi:hypothetical protein
VDGGSRKCSKVLGKCLFTLLRWTSSVLQVGEEVALVKALPEQLEGQQGERDDYDHNLCYLLSILKIKLI